MEAWSLERLIFITIISLMGYGGVFVVVLFFKKDLQAEQKTHVFCIRKK